jgi:hypothetical protein
MAVWNSGDLTVYHGTDVVSANLSGIVVGQPVNFNVQLNRCRPANGLWPGVLYHHLASSGATMGQFKGEAGSPKEQNFGACVAI